MIKFLQCIKQIANKSAFIFAIAFCWQATCLAIEDGEQPVKIQSDLALFDQEKGIATYSGNVTVDQGSRHLSSDTLTIRRSAENKIEIMVAEGKPARFKSQSDPTKPVGQGQAKIIKYYPKLDTVDLLHNAEISQNGDTVSGPMLKYNFATGNLQSKSNSKQRATVVLQPKRNK